ncbi:MAG: methyl-accepting chemotaxis protein [Acidobacteria bacterium]|nr:MAG: methyl-accepting chemotaxis protein [Acidobacteriota bacterium]
MRLRTKFIAAFVVQAFFITLLAVAIEEWRIRAGRGSPASDYILVGVAALIVAFLFAAVAAKLIIRPVLDLAETATRIAEGDLTQRTEIATGDEIGELAESFNGMTANLEKMLTKLQRSSEQLKSVFETVSSRSGTVVDRIDGQRVIVDDAYRSIDQLNSGVGKITGNVESLSAASEETSASMLEMAASIEEVSKQTDTLFRSVEDTATATEQMVSSINEVDRNVDYLASFVSETSSSMVEMTASIGQVEANAARSYDRSLAAAQAAESGMKAVRETIEAMEHIRKAVVDANGVVTRLGERSVAIGRILNVIEDVAEQTNLLALNAAILAAQAGEHGKGFSVVAGEIRELAERTASSTREIGALIQSVQQEVRNALASMQSGTKLVEEGVALSHDAGKALTNILESATTSSNMGKEIAAATNQQAKGSENITRAVEKLQGMVKQINAATAQQAQGSEHIRKAVDSMRDVARYVRQAMTEQKTGSSMISASAEHMIERIHQIFQAAANQSTESETIMKTVRQVREIAEENRRSASEMNDSLTLLSDAIRSLDEEVRKFRVRA